MADAHKNFAVSAVATAPSPATSGTSLIVTAGHGTRFPAVPFNATIWPTASQPTPANAEIVRVTGISTDTLTIARAQESTTARTVVVGDQIAATITAKSLTDIELGDHDYIVCLGLGFKGWTAPPWSDANSNLLLASGTTRFSPIGLRAGDQVTNIHVRVQVVANTVTLIKAGIYDTAGNRLATSANLTTALASQGVATLALTAPYDVPASGMYYFAILSVATTAGTLSGSGGTTGQGSALGANPLAGGQEASQTDLDTTATIAIAQARPHFAWS